MLYDLRTVGVDLRDLWRPVTDVTPRLVLWLAGQLPPESAFHAALRGGPEQRPWTTTGHLLAGVVNLLYAANKQRAGKRVGSLPVRPPKGAAPKRAARMVTVAEIAARQQADDHT